MWWGPTGGCEHQPPILSLSLKHVSHTLLPREWSKMSQHVKKPFDFSKLLKSIMTFQGPWLSTSDQQSGWWCVCCHFCHVCLTCGSSHIHAVLEYFSHLSNTNHLRDKGVELGIPQHLVKLKHSYEKWAVFSEFILPWCSSFLSRHFSCLCCRFLLSFPRSVSEVSVL